MQERKRRRLEGLTCQQPQDGGAGSVPVPLVLLELASGVAKITDGITGSTRVAGAEGVTGQDCAAVRSADDAVVAS